MVKRRRKNPFPFMSSFNEPKFQPFIKVIGQSTLLWNDLHEWMSHLYCRAVGAGIVTGHLQVWHAVPVDRTKREMLLAGAKFTFTANPIPKPTPRELLIYESIKWLCDRAKELEDDRNNAIHAPLWQSQVTGDVWPRSGFGNKRAERLDDKYLLPEYRRLRDAAHLLRNYAAAIYDPIGDGQLPWPDRPKLPDRGATKKPPSPRRPIPAAKRSLPPIS